MNLSEEKVVSSSNSLSLRYLEAVLKVNETLNLTRIDSWDRAVLLHIEDSLAALPEMNDAPSGLYGDLGSGGGFPGVPLAIETGRRAVLVDSVRKKMAAVGEILASLGLSDQIETYAGRIEELSRERAGDFSVLTARALSSLPSLLELATPLLCDKGRLICFKGKLEDEEFNEARAVEDMLGFTFLSRRSLLLDEGAVQREILVFEKTHLPSISLPRKAGFAQKKPLRPRS